MKSTVTIVGILLIILGIVGLAYHGITYTKREQVAQLGDLKVTADTEKSINFPPYLGCISLVAGVILVFVGRRK